MKLCGNSCFQWFAGLLQSPGTGKRASLLVKHAAHVHHCHLKLSIAYLTYAVGHTERCNRIFLQMLCGSVHQHHTDLPHHIPALLCWYQDTVHSASGFNPHRLLFGLCPWDIRALCHAYCTRSTQMRMLVSSATKLTFPRLERPCPDHLHASS